MKGTRIIGKAPSIIILDLDNTLIHSLEPERGGSKNDQALIDSISRPPDFTIDAKTYTYNVYKRPYVDDFLKYVTHKFDHVIVWSAGTDTYVKLIVKKLFDGARIKQPFMVLTRKDCDTTPEGSRKNMHTLKRRLAKLGMLYDHNQVLFIDDLPYKIKHLSKSRIYPIKSFDADKDLKDDVFKSFRNRGCDSLTVGRNVERKSSELVVKCLPQKRSRKEKKARR
jgi:hypothetical protein